MRRIPIVRAAAFIAVLALQACGPATPSQGAAGAGRDPNVLTGAEIAASPLADAPLLDAIRTLRPTFLVARGTADRHDVVPTVQVVIDNGSPGPLSLVEEVRARNVASVRRLSSEEAGQRFGLRDVYGPVLIVRLR